MLRLYLLMPSHTNSRVSPWRHTGAISEMVVYARSEEDARRLAHDHAGPENISNRSPWLSKHWSTCVKLNNRPSVISRLYK